MATTKADKSNHWLFHSFPALHLTIAFTIVFTLSPISHACSVPPGGCINANCLRLKTLSPPVYPSGNTQDPAIGRYAGGFNYYWNTTDNRGTEWENVRGGPYVNWEVFPQVEATYLINSTAALSVTNLGDCCTLCAQTAGCAIFQFFTDKNISRIPGIVGLTPTTAPGGAYTSTQQCYLLTGGSVQEAQYGSPFSGPKSLQIGANKYIAPSWVGGTCNPAGSVIDDPHFTGAYGTRFDFNGAVDRFFNLISDERVHMNIKLGGYLDSRTYGASALENGKAIRTWIREIGLLWMEGEISHSLTLASRPGKSSTRDSGYLASAMFDGAPVLVPSTPAVALDQGSVKLSYTGTEHQGAYEVDTFQVQVKDLIDITLKLRPAHPLLQTPEEAFVHFNIHVNSFTPTPNVHGVLGQTFRASQRQAFKALEYQMLTRLMGAPIVADGASGEGFLDGSVKDYEVDSMLSTSGKYCVYAGRAGV